MFVKPTESEMQQIEALAKECDKRERMATSEEERAAIHDEYSEKLTIIFEGINQRHFEKIATSPDAILADAEEQVELAIYRAFENIIEYATIESLKKSSYITFVDGEARLLSKVAIEWVKEEISLHIEALKDNAEYSEQLFSFITEAVKTSKYTDNKEIPLENKKRRRARPKASTAPPARKLSLFAPIPNGSAIAFASRVLNNTRPGNEKRGTKPRYVESNPNNRHEKITTEGNTEHAIIERKNKQTGEVIRLEFSNPELIFKSGGKAFCKMLDFTMQEMNAQRFPQKVEIRIQDLIDRGMYSTPSNARTAVYNFFNLQTNIKIGGTDKRGRNRAKYPCGVLFYHYDPCKKGYISLYVNSEIDIDFYAHYFTIMPQYAYALSDNGYALIRYIFYLARQRKQMKSIRDNGGFNISLDTIREALGFPTVDEVKNRKYKHCIIKPITDAVNESMKAWEATEKEEGDAIEIIMHGTDTTNIKEWLQGYIEVRLSGALANYFIEQVNKSEKEIARLKKLREEAQARAIASKKAKNIEQK